MVGFMETIEQENKKSASGDSPMLSGFKALHFAPPEARDLLDRDGLLSDHALFEPFLDRYDLPAWFKEQMEVERVLKVEELNPLHLFIVPNGAVEIIKALQAERGIDIREVNIGPFLERKMGLETVWDVVQKGNMIVRTPQSQADMGEIVLIQGKGMSYERLQQKSRTISTKELLFNLLMFEISAFHSGDCLTVDDVIEVILFSEHPERISFVDCSVREIHQDRAQKLHKLRREKHPEDMLSGRICLSTFMAELSVFKNLFSLIALVFGILFTGMLFLPGATWTGKGIGVALLFVLYHLLLHDQNNRFFIGVHGLNLILHLSDTAWTIPRSMIHSVEFIDSGHPKNDAKELRLVMKEGQEIIVPFHSSGISAKAICGFLERHLQVIHRQMIREQGKSINDQIITVVFMSPLVAGTQWPHGDGKPVAEILCFNPNDDIWLVTVQTHFRALDDRDASQPHRTGQKSSQFAWINPGEWHTFLPYPGWYPDGEHKIWFNFDMRNEQIRTCNPTQCFPVNVDYDLENAEKEAFILPDGREGWVIEPVRVEVKYE
jgi:hypothetical protein